MNLSKNNDIYIEKENMQHKKSLSLMISLLCSFAIYSMDQKKFIKQQIDAVNAEHIENMRLLMQQYGTYFSTPFFEVEPLDELYRNKLAAIVLKAEGLMPDMERLSYLKGDWYYTDRKKIVCHMIEKQRVNPNTIVYDEYTPLFEAVAFKDKTFIEYLLSKGAQPDAKTAEMMKNGSLYIR